MFEAEKVYHIYNQANGNENLFREEKNYPFFLEKYNIHIQPVARTYAWCLLPNHFHLMIRIRKEEEIVATNLTGFGNLSGLVSQQFSNLFNAYTKAINKTYSRKGSLFQRPFKHKEVTNAAYFTQLILYIHNNPVKHGFVESLYDWPHSSWQHYVSSPDLPGFENLTGLAADCREEVLDWFSGPEHFQKAHEAIGDIRSVFD